MAESLRAVHSWLIHPSANRVIIHLGYGGSAARESWMDYHRVGIFERIRTLDAAEM